MKYLAKTLFQGYKIGLMNPDWYIAVPTKKMPGGKCSVTYGKETREVTKDQIVTKKTFPDKFGRGDYTLNYILWRENE